MAKRRGKGGKLLGAKPRNPLRGVLSKSFLERSQRIIGLIAVVVFLSGSAFALLLSGGVFASTYGVTAYFSDAAGIQPGDAVTVAGLSAGMVKGLSIEHGQVAIDLAINNGVELSRDSRAAVVIQTLLGKKTVEITDGQEKRDLVDGDVIPLQRTTTPIDIIKLNDISVRLLNKSDAQAFNQFLAEVTKVTSGKEVQVRELIVGLTRVVKAVEARKGELSHLIDSLRTLFTTLGEKSPVILSLIDRLDPVLANLAARQRQIQTLLVSTDSASHETADLIIRNRATLDSTLQSLHSDLAVIDQHQLDLAATISYLDQAVQGYASVGWSQGVPNRWANIFVQSLGPAGVDALLGKCGAVDQLIDKLLGTNCKSGGILPTPLPTPSLPIPSISVPCLPILCSPKPSPPAGINLPTPSLPVPTPTLSIPKLPSPSKIKGPAPKPTLPIATPSKILSPNAGAPAPAPDAGTALIAPSGGTGTAFPGTLGDLVRAVLRGWTKGARR